MPKKTKSKEDENNNLLLEEVKPSDDIDQSNEPEDIVDDVNENDEEVDKNENHLNMPMVIESMDAQLINWNVSTLVEMIDNKKINFNVPIQRGYVWNNKKDSLAIRSIIRRVPISNFYFNRIDGIYEGLEGKQRSNAIYFFVKNNYKLHANTPPVKVNGEVYQIARKKFKHLPQTIQNRILGYNLDGYWFEDMTVDEKVEFFILTNSGKPVTAAEISRIRIKSREAFLELADHTAIKSATNEKAKRKCIDEDIASQLWCMCYYESDSLLQKHIGPILETTDVSQEQMTELVTALDYLAKLYQEIDSDKKLCSKMKRKSHVLSLAYMGYLAYKNGIPKESYSQKAIKFFTTEGRTATVSDEYNKSVGAGSSKPDQMKIRKDELKNALGI